MLLQLTELNSVQSGSAESNSLYGVKLVKNDINLVTVSNSVRVTDTQLEVTVEYLLMAFVVAQLMNVSGPIWPQAFKSRSCDSR
jgi:hypothetical protein